MKPINDFPTVLQLSFWIYNTARITTLLFLGNRPTNPEAEIYDLREVCSRNYGSNYLVLGSDLCAKSITQIVPKDFFDPVSGHPCGLLSYNRSKRLFDSQKRLWLFVSAMWLEDTVIMVRHTSTHTRKELLSWSLLSCVGTMNSNFKLYPNFQKDNAATKRFIDHVCSTRSIPAGNEKMEWIVCAVHRRD